MNRRTLRARADSVRRAVLPIAATLVWTAAWPAPAGAQHGASAAPASASALARAVTDSTPPQIPRLPNRWWWPSANGDVELSLESYQSHGTAPRLPGTTSRMSIRSDLSLWKISAGVDLLVSTQGSDLQRRLGLPNTNQIGINPRFGWGTAHLGDFAQELSPYTLSGIRTRGAGLEAQKGWLRVAGVGGYTQRTVSAGSATPVFRRRLYAGTLGFGSVEGTHLDVTVLKAKDDVTALEQKLIELDTVAIDVLDTLDADLAPRLDSEARPQENLVVGAAWQAALFDRRLRLDGEAAAALVTKDLLAPELDPDALEGGLDDALGGVQGLRTSTSGDYAYRLAADLALTGVRVRAGYEYIGAGYRSLGLAYLISDKRAWSADAVAGLLAGRLTLQGQLRHQNDNVADQKRATTGRDVLAGGATARLSNSVSVSVTGTGSFVANDAAVDTFVVDNRSLAFTSALAWQGSLLARRTTVSLSYARQSTSDGNVVAEVPGLLAQNVGLTVQVTVAPGFNVAPTVSGVRTVVDGAGAETNAQVGFRGSGQFLEGRVRTSANVTHSRTSRGRDVLSVTTQTQYTLVWDTRATLQTRYRSYSAFGTHPAFRESTVTLGVARSFR